jgi:hypothetical protein
VTTAGELRDRIAFAMRPEVDDDGYGNVEGPWEGQFEVAAKLTYLKGGESVMAARLAGTQPVAITIRDSRAARAVTAGWRARDVRSGREFNITAAALSDDRAFILVTATAGGAV